LLQVAPRQSGPGCSSHRCPDLAAAVWACQSEATTAYEAQAEAVSACPSWEKKHLAGSGGGPQAKAQVGR